MRSLKWPLIIIVLILAGLYMYLGATRKDAGFPVTRETDKPISEAPVVNSPAGVTAISEEQSIHKAEQQTEKPRSAETTNPITYVNPFAKSSDVRAIPKSRDAKTNENKTLDVDKPIASERRSNTVRDLTKEIPNSYPIKNAEIYYVPPEERYPGHLGGPPPLKLPPIATSTQPPASSSSNANSGEVAGDQVTPSIAPPAAPK